MFDLKEILKIRIREYFLFRKMEENHIKDLVQNNNYNMIEYHASEWKKNMIIEGELTKILNASGEASGKIELELDNYIYYYEKKNIPEVLLVLEELKNKREQNTKEEEENAIG